MFCKNCGEEIKENKKFCTNCGNPVLTERSEKQDELNQSSGELPVNQDKRQEVEEKNEVARSEFRTPNNSPKVSSRQFNKKQKLGALIAIILIVIGVLGYKVGENLTSKERTIEKFTEALVEGDADKVLKHVVSADPNLKITSENLQVTLDYLSEKKYQVSEIMSSLHTQASKLDRNNKEDESFTEDVESFWDDYEDEYMFKLKKQGKVLNIFDKYVIEIKPIYVELSTNLEGTDLYIGEELICTSDEDDFSKEVGPYMPGMYKMKAVYEGEYTTLESEELVDLYDAYNYGKYKYVNLDTSGNYITIDSDIKYSDAKVFINDIDTDRTILDSGYLGPIPEGAKIYAIKNVNGKEIKSEEVIYNYRYYIYLDFPEDIEKTTNTTSTSNTNKFNW